MDWARLEQYINEELPRFIDELMTFCRIPSVSATGQALRPAADFLAAQLRAVGVDATIMPMGGTSDPPFVCGRHDAAEFGAAGVFVYGHFDVQPPGPADRWISPPFEPAIRDTHLFGRGTSDAKAQIFAHVKALESIRAIGGKPVNLRMAFDPQEEIGTPMMEQFVRGHPGLFSADFGISADGEAFPGDVTTLTFGNRGNCYLTLSLSTADREMHSGMYGGVAPNAAWRMVDFLGTLRDATGRVLIDGFYDNVGEATADDLAALRTLPTDIAGFVEQFGIRTPLDVDRSTFWERIMFHPTCNIAGIRSGAIAPGTMTIIPGGATAKLEMRLVGGQQPDDIKRKLLAHAQKCGYGDLMVEEGMMYRPARTPLSHPATGVVRDAVRYGFGHEPYLVPVSGGSGPRYIWSELAGIPLIEIAYAQHNALAHAPNENMSLDRFRSGILASSRIFAQS